ncbi:hypothetical protein EVAR_70576_1 [Eumeta japonica]|uniref:Uncharacterized protein n=1 Tax=Eumeta variegata TaxID=151549 RepID=A0A4C1TG24_EUMVA|nr:hypothetical protein EVAR_70576_1 [Eumeta japonica]
MKKKCLSNLRAKHAQPRRPPHNGGDSIARERPSRRAFYACDRCECAHSRVGATRRPRRGRIPKILTPCFDLDAAVILQLTSSDLFDSILDFVVAIGDSRYGDVCSHNRFISAREGSAPSQKLMAIFSPVSGLRFVARLTREISPVFQFPQKRRFVCAPPAYTFSPFKSTA